MRSWMLICFAASLLSTADVSAESLIPLALPRPAPAAPLERQAFDTPPAQGMPGAEDPRLLALWSEALSLEASGALIESNARYEALSARLTHSPAPRWRMARNYWLAGERLPDDDAERLPYFEASVDWAKRGQAVDGRCAECMLWEYAALSRIIMSEGMMSGVRHARTLSRLLDDGIALEPTYRDNRYNSTLGNLYYARAIFNRMVPEWFWLKWVVGVKGDKEQALEDIERAVEISAGRIDYQVEKGAVLLCLGTARKKEARIDEGQAVLREAIGLRRMLESDETDIHYARMLLREPEKACGFTRRGFIDVESAKGKI